MSVAPRPSARSSWTAALIACMTCLAALGTLAAGGVPGRADAIGLGAADDTVDTSSLGCGSAEVTKTLASGSAWRMCARIDSVKGLVLEQVQFRPATGDREYKGWLPVIDSLYLAQLVVPYDSGAAAFNDVTGYGFGDAQLLPQTERTCPGQTMPVEQSFLWGPRLVERTIPGICLDEVGTGLGWDSKEDGGDDAAQYTQQGHALEVSSMTKISWYEYQQKVTLTDQGTITVGLGATGDLAPLDTFYPDDPSTGWPIGPEGDESSAAHATSHWHNAVYRVDFGIGSGPQQVEQWDYAQPDPAQPARVEGTGTIETDAFAAEDPDPQTWWRVLNPSSLNPDGHPRSYEISNDSIQSPYDPLTRPKVSFTNNHPCQEYASDNLNAGCPGLSVPEYVAAETAPLTDPVAWVSVGFHHVDRDEDQSPMPTHWQQFSLIPRDLLAQQATTPDERSCVNGGPSTLSGSCAAISKTPPLITADTNPIRSGTVLTSDTGTWQPTRSALSYQRQWLRDGQSILGSNGAHHTITSADLGHRLAVRVSAGGYGMIAGSATSAELPIPSGSIPSSSPSPSPSSSPSPTIQHPTRTSPTLTLTQPRSAKGHPRLKIRVRGEAGTCTGSVVVRGPRGWERIRTLSHGTVVMRLPNAMVAKRARLVVRYRGDTYYLPVKRSIRLHRTSP
jgi:primary-amine oxidase